MSIIFKQSIFVHNSYCSRYHILLLFLTILITSCKEKNLPPYCTIIEPEENTEIPVYQKFNCVVDANDPDGIISEFSLYLNGELIRIYDKGIPQFPYTIYEVTKDTLPVGEHVFMAVVKDNEELIAKDVRNFTISPIKSTVKTMTADSISYNSAIVGGQIIDYGGATITETGIYWGDWAEPESTGVKIQIPINGSVFTIKLTDLIHGKKYYYKAYSRNAKGESLGEEMSFTTHTIPTVNTKNIKFYSAVQAEIGGKIIYDGGEEILENGVFWGLNPDPETTGEKIVINQFTKADFTFTLNGLSTDTKYYFIAYAINIVGYSTGEVLSFKTGKIFSKKTLVADYPFNNNANDISGNN